jgi:hypothetical protein
MGILLWFMAAPVFAQGGLPPNPPVIVTRGEATVKRAPDQAWVSISAEARAAVPADAQRTAAEAMTSVRTALGKAGVSGNAIRTTSYALQPDMEYVNGRSRVRGYIARNQIEVRVDDLQKLGGVLDAAGSSGSTSMAGLRFDLKDRKAVEEQALTLAVQDAMSRAKAIAAGAGATLGTIVRIDEQGGDSPVPGPYMAMRADAAQVATPISPGEVEIRSQVTLTIIIK